MHDLHRPPRHRCSAVVANRSRLAPGQPQGQNEYCRRVMIMRPISGTPGKVRTRLSKRFDAFNDQASFWLPIMKRLVICASKVTASETFS